MVIRDNQAILSEEDVLNMFHFHVTRDDVIGISTKFFDLKFKAPKIIEHDETTPDDYVIIGKTYPALAIGLWIPYKYVAINHKELHKKIDNCSYLIFQEELR